MIQVKNEAIKEIKKLSSKENNNKVNIRIGVKQGGCSGLSYFMKIENAHTNNSSDQVVEYEDFILICDNKSMLYVYGMSLEYENSLIGGGFKFSNPNASQTCGCGQSFNI
nr:hypothetical protein [Porphyropsis coccinea]